MDDNKLKALQKIKYRIQGTCGTCTSGKFGNDEWGTCSLYTYEHRKHTGEPRQLSIYRSGSCNDHEFRNDLQLGGFKEFVEV